MTETTTPAGEAVELRRCQAGRKSERPCWRTATERDVGETEPTLCPEHMELRRRGEDLDARLHALEATRTFLKSDVVERGPDVAGPDSATMREYGAHLLVRSDALINAFTALIDGREPSGTERLQIIAACKEASKRAHEEYEKFREEQGLNG
jgi:hypothetical protein